MSEIALFPHLFRKIALQAQHELVSRIVKVMTKSVGTDLTLGSLTESPQYLHSESKGRSMEATRIVSVFEHNGLFLAYVQTSWQHHLILMSVSFLLV